MKHIIYLFLIASVFNLSAAVPLRWTVETSRVQPATFDAYQGETLTFEAALQSYGKPLAAPAEYAVYWQTNGMGNAWWSRPCVTTAPSPSAPTNVLFATWSPDMDVGAKVYSCFIGLSNSIYRAAFQLRLRPSPGALPNALPLPTPVIDFAKVTVLNPPWSGGGSGGVDTNAVELIANTAVETNAVTRALVSATNDLTMAVDGKFSREGGTIIKQEEILESAHVDVRSRSGGGVKIEAPNAGIDPPKIEMTPNGGGGVSPVIVLHDSDAPETYAGRAEVIIGDMRVRDTLAVKRDLTNNVCAASSFGPWDYTGPYHIVFESTRWVLRNAVDRNMGTYAGAEDSTMITLIDGEPGLPEELHRQRVATSGETFVTTSYVTNAVSAAVSTNNPAFVSAVRNTPTSGMPEDMPTDWGTYGTFGAALAALAAFVKWAKTKIVAVIGDDGKPTDDFAGDLMSKPVAKEKVSEIIAERVSELDPDEASVYDLIKALKGE